MKVFSGSSNQPLAEKIAQVLAVNLSPLEIFVFPDGERRIKIDCEVLEEDCVIVQSTAPPVDGHYMELFFIIDGLKRSGAKSITVVIPYVGYQRQDHVFRSGESVSLDVVIKILEALQVDRIITIDLHSIKIPELFHIPIVHLSALSLFAEVIKEEAKNRDIILVSPDMGGLRRIQKTSEMLGDIPWIATVKDRDLTSGEIVTDKFDGPISPTELSGKRAIIVDDMVSSGKTIAQSAALLQQYGVVNCDVFATHPIFSQDAPQVLQGSAVENVWVTDSVFLPEEKHFAKLHILSIADMITKNL